MHDLAMLEPKKLKIIAGDGSLLQSLLGGVPSVITLAELGNVLTKGGNYQQVIVRIIGGSTGYAAGYVISDHFFPPKYDDPAIRDWLSHITDSDYSEIKRMSLIKLIYKWEQTGGESDEKLRDLNDRLHRPNYIPSNEDFSVFAELVPAPNQSL